MAQLDHIDRLGAQRGAGIAQRGADRLLNLDLAAKLWRERVDRLIFDAQVAEGFLGLKQCGLVGGVVLVGVIA